MEGFAKTLLLPDNWCIFVIGNAEALKGRVTGTHFQAFDAAYAKRAIKDGWAGLIDPYQASLDRQQKAKKNAQAHVPTPLPHYELASCIQEPLAIFQLPRKNQEEEEEVDALFQEEEEEEEVVATPTPLAVQEPPKRIKLEFDTQEDVLRYVLKPEFAHLIK